MSIVHPLLTEDDPIMNAAMSVTEVTVMDTPACFRAYPTLKGIAALLLSGSKFSRA